MPTYEYACTKCGQHVEVFQHFGDAPPAACGVCGGPLRKVFHPAGILFKGSGFYKTDSRSSSRTASKPTENVKASADSGSGSKSSDGKSSSSSDSKSSSSSSSSESKSSTDGKSSSTKSTAKEKTA